MCTVVCVRNSLWGLAWCLICACTPSGPQSIAGPSGSKLEVPAGALKSPAALAITAVTAGYPSLPSAAAGSVYALTPHGQVFEVPVRLTLPATAAQTRLLTAQPGGQWTEVPGAHREGDSLVAEVSHFSFFVLAPPAAMRVVIGDGWAVREIDPVDGGARTLVDGTPMNNYVTAVAVDAQGRVYWLDNVSDALARVDANGAGKQVLYTAPDAFLNPTGLAIDSANSVLFWAQGHDVMKAQLDGSGAVPLVAGTNNEYPVSVAVAGGFVFWTDEGTDTVNRIGSDGTSRVVLHTTADLFANPRALSVDLAAGLLFWGEGFGLVAFPLDGGALTTVVAGTVDVTAVTGTAIDAEARQLYWTDNGTDALSRANYDGSGRVTLYQSPFWSPLGLDAGSGAGNTTNPQGVTLIH